MKMFYLLSSILLITPVTSAQVASGAYLKSLEMPCYPPLARQAQIQGEAKVKIELGADGAVTKVEAVEGHPMLLPAAVTNVRTWRLAAGSGENLKGDRATVVFTYKLQGEPGWQRCASHINFDAHDHVTIVASPPVPGTNQSTVHH